MKAIFKRLNDLIPWLFTFVVCVLLYIGWRLRKLNLITPEYGTGYLFGIIGVGIFGFLLLYPLRKRVRAMEMTGSLKMWFRVHMVLGILFPVFIMFHCNFHLGALNSNVALFSMLIVSTSGIAGRFFYRQIHFGLYGARADLIALQKQFEEYMGEAGPQFALIPGVKEDLFAFSKQALVPMTSLIQSFVYFYVTHLRALRLFWSVSGKTKVYLKQFAVEHRWGFMRRFKMQRQIERKTKRFLKQAVRIAEFSLYERLFSLWHLLHIPLVYILVFAVAVHIVAVNLY